MTIVDKICLVLILIAGFSAVPLLMAASYYYAFTGLVPDVTMGWRCAAAWVPVVTVVSIGVVASTE